MSILKTLFLTNQQKMNTIVYCLLYSWHNDHIISEESADFLLK